jgi:hypothetical protein
MGNWIIFIFSNSSHLEWRAELLDTILKGTHPCQVTFNLVQRFQRRRFKCESLRRTTDAKWWQKLTWPLARWAKKRCTQLTTASDKAYHGPWFSLGTPASSTTKTGCHDIAEILLKVALKHQKSNQIKSSIGNTYAAIGKYYT